jgi:two-component system sensor histidine kinase YesM
MGRGIINVSIACTDQRLVLVISDNGSGISEDILTELNRRLNSAIDFTDGTEERGTGIALNNVNQRIKLCFGNEYGLHVYSTVDFGTDVVITLPIVHNVQSE